MLTVRLNHKNTLRFISIVAIFLIVGLAYLQAKFVYDSYKISTTPSEQAQKKNTIVLDVKTLDEVKSKIESAK